MTAVEKRARTRRGDQGSDREESEGAIAKRARKRSRRERGSDREEIGKARPRNDRSREDEESFQTSLLVQGVSN